MSTPDNKMMMMMDNDTQSGSSVTMATLTLSQSQLSMVEVVWRLKQAVMASYLSAFVLGCVGNGLVLYVVARFKRVRVNSVANYYVWCLALADFLHVTSLPVYCWATYVESWPIDWSTTAADVSCKLAFVTSDVSRFASVLILTSLSLDRYFAGFHDLGHVRTIRIGRRACALIWLICIAFATP